MLNVQSKLFAGLPDRVICELVPDDEKESSAHGLKRPLLFCACFLTRLTHCNSRFTLHLLCSLFGICVLLAGGSGGASRMRALLLPLRPSGRAPPDQVLLPAALRKTAALCLRDFVMICADLTGVPNSRLWPRPCIRRCRSLAGSLAGII